MSAVLGGLHVGACESDENGCPSELNPFSGKKGFIPRRTSLAHSGALPPRAGLARAYGVRFRVGRIAAPIF